MNEQELREKIAQEIEDFAKKGYAGAKTSKDAKVLEEAEYINTALLHAVEIARGDK